MASAALVVRYLLTPSELAGALAKEDSMIVSATRDSRREHWVCGAIRFVASVATHCQVRPRSCAIAVH